MPNSPIRWHGGKSYLADRIVEMMCPHTHYLEPYFGGGSVLLAKDPEGTSETINDIDANLIKFWRVLRNPLLYHQLVMQLQMTPFSDFSFWEAQNWMLDSKDPVEVAAGFIVRNRMSRQGLGRSYATPTRRVRRGMNEHVSSYLSAIESLPEVHERIQRVEIRQLPAVEFIAQYDHESALFYCDPPYLHSTRNLKKAYAYEMSDEGHTELLDLLSSIKGKFMLSGYRSDLYDQYCDKFAWTRKDIQIDNKAAAGASKPTMTECVWMNF